MKQLLNVYKPQGLTPLQVIKLVQEQFPEYKDAKIGYAGRLDPLAHGVLLLMVGDGTTKQKDLYLNLSKEYEFEAVFGVSTDTYDALGILQSKNVIARRDDEAISNVTRLPRSLSVTRNDIEQFINSKLGKQVQFYPPFSSKTVNGKPLYWWARNNKLSEIKIPERMIEIYDFKLLGIKEIPAEEFKKEIMQQIDSVEGDFRQKEIKEKWKTYFTTNYQLLTTNQTARFKISCSSGTYVRSLVNELGQKLNCGAITLEILRTKVGECNLIDSLKISPQIR